MRKARDGQFEACEPASLEVYEVLLKVVLSSVWPLRVAQLVQTKGTSIGRRTSRAVAM